MGSMWDISGDFGVIHVVFLALSVVLIVRMLAYFSEDEPRSKKTKAVKAE